MPDNTIDIRINLNTTESGTSLQRLRQELNRLISDTERASRQQLTTVGGGTFQRIQNELRDLLEDSERVQRQQGWAGIRGIEKDTENIKAQIAALRELKTEAERTKQVNLEYALGPEPSREIITTRRLPMGMGSSLSTAASTDEEQRERRKQALVRETTAVVETEQAKRTRAEERQATQAEATARRAAIARQREIEVVGNAAIRAATEREKSQQVYDNETESYESSFKKQELIQVRAFEKYQEQTKRREAVAREAAEQEVYVTAHKENRRLDQEKKTQDALYQRALQENKEFDQARHRGFYSIQDAEEIRQNDINQQEILRRMPSRRQAMASYAEDAAARESTTGGATSRFFGRLNRQGALEGQAAVINFVQAAASGMSLPHVALMEGTQLAGAAVQGGLISLNQILTFVGSSAGVAAVALSGIAAVLGQIIYTGSQARTAMLTTQGSLTARGFGGESVISQENLIRERQQLKNEFRNVVGPSDISEIFSRLNNAAPEAQQFRGRLAETTVALAGTQNVSVEDASKALAAAAEGGAQGLIKFTEQLNIGDAISRERLSTLAQSDPVRAFDEALRLIQQRTEPGRAAAATEGPWLIPALPKIMASFQADVNQGTIYNSLRYLFTGFAPIDQTKSTPRVPQELQTGLNLAVAGTPEMKERNQLQEEYNKLLATQRELLQSIDNLPQGGPEIDIQMERLSRVNESVRNIEARDRPKGIEETRTDASRMAQLQRNLALAQQEANNDISQAYKVRTARAAIDQETTRQHAAAVELQANNSRKLSQAEIQAAQETEAARRTMAQRSIDIMLQLSNLERARIGPANISAQREIVDRNVASVERDKDVDQSVVIGQRTEQVNIRRQERMEVENVNIAQIRQGELILQAKEDLAGIVTLRQQEAAIIERSQDRSPAEKIQARTNVLQSQIQASVQARRLELDSVNSIGQAEERRFQTVSSLLNLQVASGTARTWQTLPLEQQITSQGTDVQAARLQALLNTGSLERSERIRVNEQLATLYEQDAQKQIELQTRVTESIKAENARRVENFKNFFSSIETASADLLTAGLLKSQTKEQALKSFATSVVTSFVKETENMASKYAGKGLAKLLDVKLGEGEDSSISNVLAKKAGSLLGITLDEPKLNQAAIADRMKEAGDAQKQAGDLMLQAAREMGGKAAEAPYRSGKATEFSTDIARETERRASTAGGGTVRTYPGDAGDKVAATLRDRGWSDAAIQGALNNSMTESSLNPNAVGAAKERGLYQFHPASHIKPFEAAYGGSWTPEAQTNYMADVVEKSMPGYTKISDPKEATRQFVTGFEKPKDQSETQVSARFANNAASEAILTRVKSNEKVVSLDEPVQPTTQPTTPVQLATSVPRSDYFLNNASKVEQSEPRTVRSGMPDINTLGAPSGPKGMDYIFGKNIPRPVVGPDGEIVKYGFDPKQAAADRVAPAPTSVPTTRPQTEYINPISVAQSAEIPGKTMRDLVVEASPRYKEISGGQDMMADFQKAWGHPIAEAGTAMRLKSAYDDPQIKPLMQQADQTVKTAYPGFDVQSAFMSGKPNLDELLKLPVGGEQNQPLKVDPATVAQGVQQGQQQVAGTIKTSIQEGTTQGQQQMVTELRSSVQQGTIQGQQAEVSATQQNVQQTQTNNQTVNENSTAVKELNQTLQNNSNSITGRPNLVNQGASQSQTAQTTSAPATGNDLSSSFGGVKSGLGVMAQGLGLASSAALLFGNHLSATGKMVLGGASLLANGFTFLSSITSLLQGANTVNTVATAANTVATTANSTAQTTSAAGSGAGSLLKAIPLLGGLFEGGGVISAERGAIVAPIPSAAGGMFVKEHALPSSILSGIQSMARGGQAGAFVSGRMVSGPRVNDGKGGQLIIAHDGEMVVPRTETTMILNSIKNPVVPSAEAGIILDNRGGAGISMSPPRMSNLRSNIDNTIREAITNVASTSNTSSTNNNTTLNYTAHTTGYHPYRTRSDFESMLRQHGSTLMRWAESKSRNGSWPQGSL